MRHWDCIKWEKTLCEQPFSKKQRPEWLHRQHLENVRWDGWLHFWGAHMFSISSCQRRCFYDRFLFSSFLWVTDRISEIFRSGLSVRGRYMKKQFRVCDLLSSSCFFQNVRRCVNSVLGVVAQYFVVAAASEHVLCPAQRLACLDASFCQVIQPIGMSGGDEPPLLFFYDYWTISFHTGHI